MGQDSTISEEGDLLTAKAFDLITGKVGFLNNEGPPEELPDGSKDKEAGFELMQEAASAGNKAAQYMVAVKSLNDGNEDKCLKFIELAAHNNHAEAQVTYAAKYWWEGRNGHKIDLVQAITWMRRALAHGAQPDPDPRGNALSHNSFRTGLDDVTVWGRKLYLRAFEDTMFTEQEFETESKAFLLSAECGCASAIDIVAKWNKEN